VEAYGSGFEKLCAEKTPSQKATTMTN
jgi:hypothetical protein